MAKTIGRPKIELNRGEFEELCRIWCTQEEIQNVLNVGRDGLAAWCLREYGEPLSVIYKKYSDEGRKSLRRTQLEIAKKGNCAMAIWLGKQYLGQRDEPIDITAELGRKIVVELHDMSVVDNGDK